jgi:hypothetical protein
MIPDSGNVFERVYRAMLAFCSSDKLRWRLRAAHRILLPLRVEDFPEHMRNDFRELMEALPTSEKPLFRDKKRWKIALMFLSLYTKAVRLDGNLQEIVGDQDGK